jgi:transcriptional regulator with XRE-family HTH domain
MTKKEIGELIKQERLKQSLSYNNVKFEARIEPQQLSHVEQGIKNYTIDTLMKITTVLGLEIVLKPKDD